MIAKKSPITTALSIIYSAESNDQLNCVFDHLAKHEIHAEFWEDPVQEAYRNSSMRNSPYVMINKPLVFHLIVPEAQAGRAIALVNAWQEKRHLLLELHTKDVRRLFWTTVLSGVAATAVFVAMFPDRLIGSPGIFVGGALLGYLLYPKRARGMDPALVYEVE